MLPKSYIIAKWSIYGLATLLLAGLQHVVLNHVSLWGVTPFLYPILCALVSSYEGLQRGSKFSLVMGVLCDLLILGPFDGFYTITFTLIGIFAALIGENLLSPGWLCGFTVSSMGMVLVNLARLLMYLLSGNLHPLLMCRIALIEILITLPMLLPALPVYRWIYSRCAVDY